METEETPLPANYQVITKQQRTRKSEIELAGKQVMDHLMELGRSSDMTYPAMAQRINELYSLEITASQIKHFFKTNGEALLKLAEEQKSLSKIRADIYLEHSGVLVKDIKILDDQIEKLIDSEGDGGFLEADRRAKAVGDLIDKKGRLLIRYARLSGKLSSDKGTNIEKMQQNIFLQINNDKSELINRLKKAEFKDKKVVDIELEKTDKTGKSKKVS